MKNNSTLKQILVPAVMLFIIALVCTALLAGTNMLTKDKIDQIAVQTENNAKASVLSEAEEFSEAKTVVFDGTEYTYYEGIAGSSIKGYVIPVTTKSYGGALSIMVGISADEAKITGIGITEINDTPGLGMKAKNDSFLSQFTGKQPGMKVVKNSPAENDIQAITSATITSKAVTGAVNTAFDVYSEIKAGGSNG